MKYYELSRRSDVIDSVAEAARQAQRLLDGSQSPKWLVIAAHSAAQGAMACYLHKGNGIASWRKDDAKKWLDAHYNQNTEGEEARIYPEVRLNSFMRLYADVRTFAETTRETDITSVLSEENERLMGELNILRNSFIHFQVGSHLVYQSYVASLVQAALTTVQTLSENASFPWGHDSEEETHASFRLQLIALAQALSALNSDEAHASNVARAGKEKRPC